MIDVAGTDFPPYLHTDITPGRTAREKDTPTATIEHHLAPQYDPEGRGAVGTETSSAASTTALVTTRGNMPATVDAPILLIDITPFRLRASLSPLNMIPPLNARGTICPPTPAGDLPSPVLPSNRRVKLHHLQGKTRLL
ncbi:hypothetical protein QCA50_012677 [Cerrena zonata]|uniref:Uncharacterized protein n=1 Tax=Cerrena zonata TaxID=2478898 RepID=A0AAW0FRT3_9APHY